MYNKISVWPEYFTLIAYDQIDSTNNEAKRIAKQKLKNDFVVWSSAQTAGRGRYGKQWISKHGNLFFSMLLNNIGINFNVKTAGQIVFVVALALASSLERISGKEIKLKWPNDILIDNKKCAGILIESNIYQDIMDFIVIGVGVNITSYPEENVDFKATSLYSNGVIVKEDVLLDEFLNSFIHFYQDWLQNGFSAIRESWLVRAYHIGEKIIVKNTDGYLTGIFKGLDENGSLILGLDDEELLISTGEVFFD